MHSSIHLEVPMEGQQESAFSQRLADRFTCCSSVRQLPVPNCNLSGRSYKATLWFCQKFFKCPFLPILLICLVLAHSVLHVLLAVFVYPPQIDLRLQAFQIPNHESSLHYDAFKTVAAQSASAQNHGAASFLSRILASRGKRAAENFAGNGGSSAKHCDTRARSTTIGSFQYLDLVFVAPKGAADANVFTKERLADIHAIEMHIMNDPEYQKFCVSTVPGQCDPLNSILTYFYPTADRANQQLIYDGRGDALRGINTTLAEVIQSMMAYWYVDGAFSSSNMRSALLRSQIRVGFPIVGYCSYSDRHEEQVAKINQYFNSLVPYFKEASTNNIDVLYGGPSLVDAQVTAAIVHDATLAAISGAMIVIVVFLSTGCSATSTVAAIVTIVSCFPLAFFMYRVVFSIEAVGVLNVISLFVIIGIGVDDVFIFINTFKQSGNMASLPSLPHRLAYTILSAGKATFFTSLTTAVAFFANAAIEIPAVRQFGIFMGLVILLCYVQVLLLLPPFLYLWARWFSRAESCCASPLLWVGRIVVQRVRRLHLFRWHRLSDVGNASSDSEPVDGVAMSSLENGKGGDGGVCNRASSKESIVALHTNPFKNNSDSGISVRSDEDDVEPLLNTVDFQIASDDRYSFAHQADSCAVKPKLVQSCFREGSYVRDDSSSVDDLPLSLSPTPVMSLPTISPSIVDSNLHSSMSPERNASRDSSACGRQEELHNGVQNAGPPEKEAPASTMSLLSLKAVYLCIAKPVVFLRVAIFILFGLLLVSGVVCAGFLHSSGDLKLFSDDSNLQRLLDLMGNLTSVGDYDCAKCSAYYTHKYGSYKAVVTTSSPPRTPRPTTQPAITPPTPTDRLNASEASASPSLPPATPEATTKEPLTSPPTESPTYGTTPPATSAGTGFTHTSKCSGSAAFSQCLDTAAKRPDFGGNAIVFVVLGVSGFQRNYSPTHVLPKTSQLGTVIYNDAFAQSLRYTRTRLLVDANLMKAMCRLCQNISDPSNGLVQPRGAKCFPSAFLPYLKRFSECAFLKSRTDDSATALTVDPLVYVEQIGPSDLKVKSVIMAFRSVVNPNGFNINNKQHYQRWNSFISSEIEAVRRSPKVYGNASAVLQDTFHASSYWVLLNLEVVAVEGAATGIALSVGVCLITLILLFGNWRILVSISLTIVGIFFSVLLFFKAFGWSVGAVEAVCLAVLVGNSLDYCIHLSQCYLSTTEEHLDIVDKFGVSGSLRKRKAISALTHISSSVLSSAGTTIVATLPLLAAEVHPFRRFGAILLLNTAVAIVYTLCLCAALLSVLGPKERRYFCCRAR